MASKDYWTNLFIRQLGMDSVCCSKCVKDDNEKTGLTPPWVGFVTMLRIMLTADDVRIDYDPDTDPSKLRIYVDSLDKAYAIEKLLPKAVHFGNVSITIEVIPSNTDEDTVSLFKKLFKDSPIVEDIITIAPEGTNNAFTYILFKKDVVEFWNDNIGNPHGYSFALLEDIAEELFEDRHDGVFFTTASSKD